MNTACTKRDVFGMNIGSPDFIQERLFRGFLVIMGQESFCSDVAKKNILWFLRHGASKFLRPEDSAYSGFILRRQENLSGSGDQARLLSEVWDSEAGEIVMACREPLLHEEICFCGGTALSSDDDHGHGQRVSFGLEDGQRTGQTIHAGTVEESRNSSAEGHRNRRDIDSKRAYLSNRSKRPNKAAGNLVWRGGSIRSEHEQFLRLAWAQEGQESSLGGNGHVEGFRKVGKATHSSSCDSLRQVPCDATFRRGFRQGAKAGICQTLRQGSFLHQRAEVHAAIAKTEFGFRWSAFASQTLESQQETQHGLSVKGDFRSAVELRYRRLGEKVFQQLARFSQMAETGTLSGIRKIDRTALGRNRGLLSSRQQSLIGFRGRIEQQDTGDSTTGLRTSGRRISSPQNPDLHA